MRVGILCKARNRYLYCGHPRDRKLLSLIARVRNSGNLFQSNQYVIYFCQGFSCCPHYRGVGNSEVSAIQHLISVVTGSYKRLTKGHDKFGWRHGYEPIKFRRKINHENRAKRRKPVQFQEAIGEARDRRKVLIFFNLEKPINAEMKT